MLTGNKYKYKYYDYEVDLNGGSSCARIIRMVGSNKRVLELGPGPGSISKYLKNENNCKIVAIENDKTAIKLLSKFCEKVYEVDLNDSDWPSRIVIEEKFDVVVAGDVLEHLIDPWSVLKELKNLITNDGFLVVSLPHVGHNSVIASILNYDFAYQNLGLLDRTHLRFFGMKNIKQLFDSIELRIDEAQFVTYRPDETELGKYWQKLSTSTRDALSVNKYGKVYQVVIKTLSKTSPKEGIDLLGIDVDMSESSRKEKFKKMIYWYCPPALFEILWKYYSKIKRWL